MTTLQTVTASQANKETPFGENFETVSAAGIYGRRHPATAGLVWGYYGGLYNGNTSADGTVALTNTADNYVVVLRSTGVVSVSTSSANSTNPLYAKLYKVPCASGAITEASVIDQRWDTNGLFFSGASSSGTSVPATRYNIELANTTDSDPGAGLVKFNNATPTSATFLYIDDSTSDGVDLSTYFAGLGASGYITIQSVADAGEWAIFKWTAITDGTGYFKFAVTNYASLGTLDDADAVLISFDSDASGAGGGTIGQHMLPIMAAAMSPRITGGCGTILTEAGASDQPDINYLPFDSASAEGADFSIAMPESWDEGTVTFKPIWKHPATTTNFGVVWRLRAVAFSDDDAMAANFGTGQTSTDTGGTTKDHYVGPASSAITIAGSPAAGDTVCFNIERIVSDGADTMAVDAHLIGIRLYYTTAAETD